jgi:RNA polymerase primary sigma factor
MTSLDQPVGEDGETAFGDLLASDRPEPLDEIADADRDRQVNELVDSLPEDEREVIQLRFGLAGDEPRTPRQTGMQLGITTEQVRKLEEQGLRRLSGRPELEALRLAA